MKNLSIVGIVAALILGFLSVYTVSETEQALVVRFGEPVTVVQEPGLNFKWPVPPPFQNVVYLDKRLLDLNAPPEEVTASDQERLIVDAFAKFQIVQPLQFYQTVNNEQVVRQRLSRFLNSNMRRVLGAVTTESIVSGERENLMDLIEQGVNSEAEAAGLGVVIKDVRIRRADLPEANSQAVFERMQSQRRQEAAQFRAEGEEQKRRIEAEAEKQRTVILARAQEAGQIMRGSGDSLRTAIFACAFDNDPDFFAFYRSMQAYERSFKSDDTTMVLSPDSDFFRFFGNSQGIKNVPSEDFTPSTPFRSSDPLCQDGSYDLSSVDFLQDSAPTESIPAPTME